MFDRSWIELSKSYEPPVHIKDEVFYFFKRVLVDIGMFLPLLFFVFIIFFRDKLIRNDQIRMVFGTHPIVTFNVYVEIIKCSYDSILFVFDDYSKGNFHNGITLQDILPNYIKLRSPYFLGSYFAFFWAIKNFNIFHLYFDGGFLERTIWWRFEPLVYQLLQKKVVLYPYGTDTMTLFNNSNLSQKIGHMVFSRKYFNMDFKRFKRTYWWSKYATLIIGFAPFIKFLPRIDVLIWHGQITEEIKDIRVNSFDENSQSIKILHFANHKIRKGSYLIEKVLQEVCQRYEHVEYECIEGVSREIALKKLNECDIFIDSLIDGYFQFSSLDAMIRAKVTLSFYDEEINNVFKQLNTEYYDKFLDEFPGININVNNLKDKLINLIDNPKDIAELSLKSHVIAKEMIEENTKSYRAIIDKLVKS